MPPKRKPTSKDDSDKPGKRAKPDDTQNDDYNDEDSEEELTAELERKNARRYELTSGTLDPPTLHTKDTSKLTLHFRKIEDSKEETLTFKKIPIDEIVWSDKTHIGELRKWRRQVLRRKGFPVDREVMPWQPREEAFLELLYRALQDRVDRGERVRGPTTAQVMDHFNAFFEGRRIEDGRGCRLPPRAKRKVDSIGSKLRRETELGKVVKAVKGNLSTDKELAVKLPDITDKQLDEFLGKSGSISRSRRKGATDRKTRRVARKRRRRGSGSGSNTVPSGFQDGIDDNTENTDDQLPVEDPNSSTPSKKTSRKRPQKPTEAPAPAASSNDIDRMRNRGWQIPTISQDTDATKESEDDKDTLNDDWMYKAVNSLHDRWSRSKTNEFGYLAALADTHKWKNYDPVGKRKEWYQDRARKSSRTDGAVSARRQDAQVVNAVLGLAICPPVGYGGHVNDLLERRVEGWSKFDLALAKENRRALRFHYGMHDARFEKYYREHVKKMNRRG